MIKILNGILSVILIVAVTFGGANVFANIFVNIIGCKVKKGVLFPLIGTEWFLISGIVCLLGIIGLFLNKTLR